jgi:DNA-binding response OmpR family regulator
MDLKEAFRNGKNLNLTKKEFRLLEYFLNHQGKLLTKSEIAENVWDISFDTGTNIVEVYVNYLRNKLDKGYEEKLIQTKFGHGYIFGQK